MTDKNKWFAGQLMYDTDYGFWAVRYTDELHIRRDDAVPVIISMVDKDIVDKYEQCIAIGNMNKRTVIKPSLRSDVNLASLILHRIKEEKGEQIK